MSNPLDAFWCHLDHVYFAIVTRPRFVYARIQCPPPLIDPMRRNSNDTTVTAITIAPTWIDTIWRYVLTALANVDFLESQTSIHPWSRFIRIRTIQAAIRTAEALHEHLHTTFTHLGCKLPPYSPIFFHAPPDYVHSMYNATAYPISLFPSQSQSQ
jgi:hypothetical protein